MPPKKPKTTMSLNEFLGDSAYGSWADEMDDFPTAPSRGDEPRGSALSRAPDRSERSVYPPRDELPLPTQPPYTAFVGNLPFDLSERDLGNHFSGSEVKSVKIIKDRDERPKGFGYVEFTTLDGLKAALDKTNTTLQNRSIRVSVAEPPKEREGGSRPFGDRGPSSGGFDDDRQWRREGPLPSRDDGDRRSSGFGGGGFERRESSGPASRFREERAPPPPSIAEETNDWRSSMRPPPPPQPERERERERGKFGGNRDFGDNTKRRGSGFNTPLDSPKPGQADLEEKWSIGSRLKPSQPSPDRASTNEEKGGGGGFGRRSGIGKPPPEPDASDDVSDWRSAPRKVISSPGPGPKGEGPGGPGRGPPPAEEKSPNPPTRRKLELLPRTNAPSGGTPLGSPRSGEPTPASATAPKQNPFGSARPVDAAAREREITEKMERTRLAAQQNSSAFSGPSSRQGSRQGSRAGSPTRSPKPTALGLGGMNNSDSAPPKILSRGGGPPSRPGGYGGRGGHGGHGGHGRTPSVTMSPKRSEGGGPVVSEGTWRRDNSSGNTNASDTNANTGPGPNSGSGSGPGPGSNIERRSSAVRPSFSFANAAGGANKGSQSQSTVNEAKDEGIAAET